MSTYGNGSGMLGRIGTWFVIGVVAIVALKVGLVVAAFTIRLGFVALFTLGPILLIGWLVIKALRYLTRERGEMVI
ncbi:MAG: hypothetical protein WD766_13940 [Gemmatimonadota bacterium]